MLLYQLYPIFIILHCNDYYNSCFCVLLIVHWSCQGLWHSATTPSVQIFVYHYVTFTVDVFISCTVK